MRVLFVAPEYPPHNIGGGGLVVKSLARSLVKMGCSVSVVAGYYPVESLFERAKHSFSDVEVILLPLLPTPKGRLSLRTVMPPNIRSFIYLFKVLARDYDVVHLHGFGHNLVDLAALYCLLVKRRRYVLTVHGFPRSPLESKGIIGILYRVYLLTFGKVLLSGAERLVAISESIKRESISRGAGVEKTLVIPNGVSVSAYNDVFLGEGIRNRFDIDNDDFLLMAVGILHERKGFQHLIEALPSVLKSVPNVKLAVVGMDGGRLIHLQEISEKLGVSRNVVFTGFLDFDTKRKLMKAADVCVIPSLVEPFGLVSLEAMACGKPIVASKVDGLMEVLEDERTALLVEPKDVKGLAGALVKLIRDKELRLFLSRNAEERIWKYDWENIGKMYFDLYAALTNQKA
jgi:glycogen(starch) synthase